MRFSWKESYFVMLFFSFASIRRLHAGLIGLLFAALLLGVVPGVPTATAAEAFANTYFEAVWNRTDKPVADGAATRTFLWGPQPFSAAVQEDYAQAPGGKRLVQYFDKSRMEITFPDSDKTSPYYVTNGLLALELMSGKLQTGDNSFADRSPSNIGVAGDPDDTSGPSYATLGGFRSQASDATGQAVTTALDRAGNRREASAEFGSYNVKLAKFEAQTSHNIAQPFWDFLNQSGRVRTPDGKLETGRLFEPVYYATGLPVTEPYWAKVKVGGSLKDVLVQAFERRVLTYTPANPAGFQVEMGNVGQHYYTWRYTTPQPQPPAAQPVAKTCNDVPNPNGDLFYSVLKCGPAGMQILVRTRTKITPKEKVEIIRYDPDGQAVQSEFYQPDGAGMLEARLRSAPNAKQGIWKLTIRSYTSGKEGDAYILLTAPVDKPTVIVHPSPSRLKDEITFNILGFPPGDEIIMGAKSPSTVVYSTGKVRVDENGSWLETHSPWSDFRPRDYVKPGKWQFSANSTTSKISVGVDYELIE
jgi:hypothetical protein